MLAPESSVADAVYQLLLQDNKATFLYVGYYATIFDSIEACPKRVNGLHVAAGCGLYHTTSLLLKRTEGENQVDLMKKTDSFGRTPLWLAAARGHTDIFSDLLSSGANITGRADIQCYWKRTKKW